MKAIVISGGGAKGAWAGGAAQALYDKGQRWDKYIGCSTGSLLAILLPSYNFGKVRKLYTSVNANSIFSVNPFTKKGKINIINALYRFIKGETSIGESGNLKKILLTEFTDDDFNNIRLNNQEAIVAVTNLTRGKIEYFSTADLYRTDFIETVIASSSVPIAMEVVTFRGQQYLDGGVMQHIPITAAINSGADEIDIIVLRPETYPADNFKAENMIDVATRTIGLLQREVSLNDAQIANLTAHVNKDLILNFYYTPEELTKNSLEFNEAKMNEWWDEGYEYVMHEKIQKVSYHICRKKNSSKHTITRYSSN